MVKFIEIYNNSWREQNALVWHQFHDLSLDQLKDILIKYYNKKEKEWIKRYPNFEVTDIEFYTNIGTGIII